MGCASGTIDPSSGAIIWLSAIVVDASSQGVLLQLLCGRSCNPHAAALSWLSCGSSSACSRMQSVAYLLAACSLLQPATCCILQPEAYGLQQPQRGVLHASLCMQHCYSSVAATGPPHGGCSRGSSFAAEQETRNKEMYKNQEKANNA